MCWHEMKEISRTFSLAAHATAILPAKRLDLTERCWDPYRDPKGILEEWLVPGKSYRNGT
jgi:hypothetical protein